MKYVTTLLVTLLLSLTAFSQSVTNTSNLTLSHRVGKQVALDLVSCDSVSGVLVVTQNELSMTESKCKMQDVIIKTGEEKINLFNHQILLYKAKDTEYQKMISELQSDLKAQKIQTRVYLYSGLGAILAASVFVIVNTINH